MLESIHVGAAAFPAACRRSHADQTVASWNGIV